MATDWNGGGWAASASTDGRDKKEWKNDEGAWNDIHKYGHSQEDSNNDWYQNGRDTTTETKRESSDWWTEQRSIEGKSKYDRYDDKYDTWKQDAAEKEGGGSKEEDGAMRSDKNEKNQEKSWGEPKSTDWSGNNDWNTHTCASQETVVNDARCTISYPIPMMLIYGEAIRRCDAAEMDEKQHRRLFTTMCASELTGHDQRWQTIKEVEVRAKKDPKAHVVEKILVGKLVQQTGIPHIQPDPDGRVRKSIHVHTFAGYKGWVTFSLGQETYFRKPFYPTLYKVRYDGTALRREENVESEVLATLNKDAVVQQAGNFTHVNQIIMMPARLTTKDLNDKIVEGWVTLDNRLATNDGDKFFTVHDIDDLGYSEEYATLFDSAHMEAEHNHVEHNDGGANVHPLITVESGHNVPIEDAAAQAQLDKAASPHPSSNQPMTKTMVNAATSPSRPVAPAWHGEEDKPIIKTTEEQAASPKDGEAGNGWTVGHQNGWNEGQNGDRSKGYWNNDGWTENKGTDGVDYPDWSYESTWNGANGRSHGNEFNTRYGVGKENWNASYKT